MSLVPASVLVVTLVGFAVTLAVMLAEPWLLRALARFEPRRRVRWLLALLAAPLAAGGAVVILALGHCILPRLAGLPDDCDGLSGHGCAFCLFRSGEVGARAWALALLCVLPLATSLGRTMLGVVRARRARRRMEAVARRGADGVLLVPGSGAFVVGWPEATIFLGEDLSSALTPEGVAAVTAHEREHQRRGDVLLRMLARTIGALHVGPMRARLLAALDDAMEQACDARASEEVADPLIVAQALLDTAHLHARAERASGCVGASLPARISALCAPPAFAPPGRAAGPAALALAAGLLAVALDHQVHALAELVSHLISR